MAQFYDFGPGGQNVTMGTQSLTWDGATNLQAWGSFSGSAGATSFVKPVGWGHSGWNILIQSQKTGVGQWEVNWCDFSGASGVARYPLTYTYGAGAQIVTLSNNLLAYNNLTINGAVTVPTWNGSTQGIAAFLCKETFTVNGGCYVNANGAGFRGSPGGSSVDGTGANGEGSAGLSTGDTRNANGSGGGGGVEGDFDRSGGGAGGGNGTTGTDGDAAGGVSNAYGGFGGASTGNANLSLITFGGGGGEGANGDQGVSGSGANAGGIIIVIAKNIIINGGLYASGNAGGNGTNAYGGGGGGGAGGSILMKSQTATLGSSLVLSSGGAGGTGTGGVGNPHGNGGAASYGRIALEYYSSYSGSTSPSLTATQNTSLKSQVYSGMI